MSEVKHSRLIILGSGPAGYSAAVYAARANLKPVVITGIQPGGQLTTTTEVDNWPGDVEGLTGPALMERMQKHAERFDTEIIYDHIHTAELQSRPFVLKGDSGTYSCDALIIATGASAQYLGLPSEEAFSGKGVSACATCDGFFYRNQVVAVIGGGNTAVEEALYLSNIAKEVHLVHRRDKLRATAVYHKRLEDLPNIEFVWDATPRKLLAEDGALAGVRVEMLKTGELRDFPCAGLFVAVGTQPNTEFLDGALELDETGYIVAGESGETAVPGVYAAGDVRTKGLRQVVTAVADGAVCAEEAAEFLAI